MVYCGQGGVYHPDCPFLGTERHGHYWRIQCPGDRAYMEAQDSWYWLSKEFDDPDLDDATREWIAQRVALAILQEAGEQ